MPYIPPPPPRPPGMGPTEEEFHRVLWEKELAHARLMYWLRESAWVVAGVAAAVGIWLVL